MAPLSCGERSWGSVPVRGSLPPTPPAAPTGARRGRAGRAGGAAGTVRHRPAGGRDGPMGRGRGEVQRPRSTQEGAAGLGEGLGQGRGRPGGLQGHTEAAAAGRRPPLTRTWPCTCLLPAAPAAPRSPRRQGDRGAAGGLGKFGGWAQQGPPEPSPDGRVAGGGRGSHRARQAGARAGTRAHAAHGSPSRWHKRPEQPGCAAQRLPPPS